MRIVLSERVIVVLVVAWTLVALAFMLGPSLCAANESRAARVASACLQIGALMFALGKVVFYTLAGAHVAGRAPTIEIGIIPLPRAKAGQHRDSTHDDADGPRAP
jgi:hypothetical protein